MYSTAEYSTCEIVLYTGKQNKKNFLSYSLFLLVTLTLEHFPFYDTLLLKNEGDGSQV